MRFGVIGLDHLHVFMQIGTLAGAGGELVSIHGTGDLAEGVAKSFPQAKRAADAREILEDESLDVVVCAAIPDHRAAIALDAMRHGKDVFVDKPGATTLAQVTELRAAQRETGRHWAVYFSERLANAATERALALVREGAVGRPVHVAGFGPHRLGLAPRPDWFWSRARSGGILGDLASHQMDQFLLATGASEVEIAAAQVANWSHPDRPDFEDVGEVLLRAEGATGYARVDWYTPDGLETWGDVRLSIVGTEGTIEVRKNCDLAGREGANHLFLVDGSGVRHIDCAADPLPFGAAFARDVRERTETALPSAHALRATELALQAQETAARLGHLRSAPAR